MIWFGAFFTGYAPTNYENSSKSFSSISSLSSVLSRNRDALIRESTVLKVNIVNPQLFYLKIAYYLITYWPISIFLNDSNVIILYIDIFML